jgi:hypothetical protein
MDEKQPKSKQSERGRETLFRVTYQHQSKLIQIADYKANMIISISTILISSIIAFIGYGAVIGAPDITSYGMAVPIISIVLTCLIALIFAIEAARPKLIKSKTWEESGQKSSLLFFGNIAGYSQQAYLEKMKILLNTEDEVYEHMTIDIYFQGLILKRKYNLLVYSYRVLLYGFIFSVLIFLGLYFFGI